MELIWRRTSIVRNWLLQPMFLVMVWSLISTNTFFLVPFGSLLDSNSSEYTNRWGNCHLSKENFTLWTYKFNTVLRSFYVLLGNRRKNKTMIKVNSRTKLWFCARIFRFPPTFLEKSPMFFGRSFLKTRRNDAVFAAHTMLIKAVLFALLDLLSQFSPKFSVITSEDHPISSDERN